LSHRAKIVLISGASRGIGKAIALKLSQKGCQIALHYYQNEAAALKTITELSGEGHGFLKQS